MIENKLKRFFIATIFTLFVFISCVCLALNQRCIGEESKMSVNKISHITLICKDIEKTGKFLKEVFGAVEYYSNDQKVYSISKEKFFKIGDVWFVTMEGDPVAKTYNHIAFQADDKDFAELRKKIEGLGLEILPGRERTKEEGDSIYFYDYDNHLFELHSGDLERRLEYYKASDGEG